MRRGGEGQAVIDINEYQSRAMRTCSVMEKPDMVINAALGLAGEAGEFCEHIKKHLFQGHKLDEGALAEELGDVMWYAALACTGLDIKLRDVLAANIEKLWRRYPEGFDSIRSSSRID
jgi:NTP pyrophosphatase (non-canonical NTP hydrolase)